MAEFFESFESRRFLSVASEIGLIDAPAFALAPVMHSAPVKVGETQEAFPSVPNIKRTYSGTFALGSGQTGTFNLLVRKEERRLDYASLRGTLTIAIDGQAPVQADMTYGKVRENKRINMTLVGTDPAFNVTITGKSSDTGSQLKGQVDVTGSVALSTTFVINKVVR